MKRLDIEKLDPGVLSLLERAGELAKRQGIAAYLVGGVVRDLLLKRASLDIDVVVEGDGIAFARLLAQDIDGKVTAYANFGVATIVCPDGMKADIVTARREIYQRPGVLPQIVPDAMPGDLFRRDFTINALAASILPDEFGLLRDEHGGLADLKAGRISILHGRSFLDDPTRILRAVRYEARFGFRMDPATLKALKEAILAGCFSTITPVRYWNEFRRILQEADPLPALERLRRLDALRFFILDSPKAKNFRRLGRFLSGDGLRYLPTGLAFWHLYGAILLLGLNRDDAESVLSALNVVREDKRKMLDILQNDRLLDMLVGNFRVLRTN